jgi:hypothetical protein
MRRIGSRRLAVGSQRAVKFACLLLTAYCLLSCGVPNLETLACVESRDVVREFYSFRFGNGLAFSADALKQRERFLTPELVRNFVSQPEGADPFTTGTSDFPKAFRVGGCTEKSAERTEFQLLLFWRDDNSSQQKTINVETVKTGDKWLIDKVNYE